MSKFKENILSRLQKSRITAVLYSGVKDTWVSGDKNLPNVPDGAINAWFLKFCNADVLYLGENTLDPPVLKSLDQCLDLKVCSSAFAEAIIGKQLVGIGTERDFAYRYLLDDRSYLYVEFDFVDLCFSLEKQSLSDKSNIADISWMSSSLPEK